MMDLIVQKHRCAKIALQRLKGKLQSIVRTGLEGKMYYLGIGALPS